MWEIKSVIASFGRILSTWTLSCFCEISVSFLIVVVGKKVVFAKLSLVISGIGKTSGFISCDLMLVREQHRSKIKSM